MSVNKNLYYMAEINAARRLVDYRSGKSHLARSGNSSCPLKKVILPARENIVQIKFLRKLKLHVMEKQMTQMLRFKVKTTWGVGTGGAKGAKAPQNHTKGALFL